VTFAHFRAGLARMFEQQMIEPASEHLKRAWLASDEAVREIERVQFVAVCEHEAGAPFRHEARLRDCVVDPERSKQLHCVGQQRLPDVESRVPILLDEHDPIPALHEHRRHRRTRRATSGDEDVPTIAVGLMGSGRHARVNGPTE
jgi:hypothetical protein